MTGKLMPILRGALASIFALLVGVGIVEYGLKMPNKLDEKKARTDRNEFCKQLLEDNKAGALAAISDEAVGKAVLSKFIQQPGKFSECRDEGQPQSPDSGGPDECMFQPVLLIRGQEPMPKNELLESHVIFQYSCGFLSGWKQLTSVGGSTWRVRLDGNSRTIMETRGLVK